MPGGDRTGPMGSGPMTGRAAGFCVGYPVPGYMNPVGGRGYRRWGSGRGFRGRGGGRGWARFGYGYPAWGGPVAGPYTPYPWPDAPAPTTQQELDDLKAQAEYLEDDLEGVKNRIEELEGQKSTEQ